MTAFEQVANDIRAAHFVQYVRAAVGCEQCGGTGECLNRWGCDPTPCPADHAVITVLGETIYADPEKCEWRHSERHWYDGSPAIHNQQLLTCPAFGDCGYQPRWSLLSGGE